jgi:serine/threonine protein phosphatase PrpC
MLFILVSLFSKPIPVWGIKIAYACHKKGFFMAFQIDTGYASLTGTKSINEDFCGAMLPDIGQEDMGAVAAVADGVSSGGMGKEAAQTTVISILRDYFGTPKKWDATVALDRIIAAQNTWLAGVNQRRLPAMGLTTLTALALRGHAYTLAHVGDSRAYLLRGGELTQLTTDHVSRHPDLKHQLLRAVGAEDRIVVDYVQGDLQVGDVFLLVTDGVHGVLRTRQLKELLIEPIDSRIASQAIVDKALQAGSTDNVTALIVRVLGLLDATLGDDSKANSHLPIPPLLKVGNQIDGLTVTAPVADNGINVLYQVRSTRGADSGKLYALKTLHPARAHDKDERAMLAHEGWLAKNTRQAEHLVRIHAQVDGQAQRSSFYLLYDWHGGETLQQMLDKSQQLEVGQVVQAAMQALKALGLLHRQGVIHRDIKPANLHLGEDGVLRVLDLGVALSGKEPASMRKLHAGTPSYINPEQWDEVPQLPDAMSDLFALGVTLYQMLTNKLPYGEVLPYQAARYHRDPTKPSRHNGAIPIWLEHVALKAVARNKAERFETAEEFLLALERGASRPLNAPQATSLLARDKTAGWKLGFGISLLFNLMLIYWLLFLPK